MGLIFFVTTIAAASKENACTKEANFDYIVLALQWPAAFCLKQSCAKHRDVWGIHGTWPNYENGSWPSDCCFERDFNIKLLDPIRADLELKWNTLKSDGDVASFWKHEWTKHGTCAKNNLILKGQLNYFKETLKLFDKYQLMQWLKDSHIVPSNQPYQIQNVFRAIENNVGKKVNIVCIKNKQLPLPVISEVYLCLGKESLKPIDCPANNKQSICGNKNILYPPTK